MNSNNSNHNNTTTAKKRTQNERTLVHTKAPKPTTRSLREEAIIKSFKFTHAFLDCSVFMFVRLVVSVQWHLRDNFLKLRSLSKSRNSVVSKRESVCGVCVYVGKRTARKMQAKKRCAIVVLGCECVSGSVHKHTANRINNDINLFYFAHILFAADFELCRVKEL